MFRSLRFYHIHSAWPESEELLSGKLENRAFKPCPAFSEQSLGFEPPVENAGDLLARRLSGADLMQLRLQSRVLPIAAVKEALVDRVADFTQRTTREPSRKEKRDLKDEVYAELLPKALLKSDRIRAFYLLEEKILAVATPSANVAEQLLDALRDGLGSLQATPLEFKRPVTHLMNEVFLGNHKGNFALGRECRMKDISEPKSTVSWADMDLSDSGVRKHVKDGLSIDRLGMQFDTVLRFTMDDDLVLRKVKLEGQEELDDLDDEDPLLRHDAEFTLASGMTRRLCGALEGALGVRPS